MASFACSPQERDLVKTLQSRDGDGRHDFRVSPSMRWALIHIYFFLLTVNASPSWRHTDSRRWEALYLLSVELYNPGVLKSDCHLQIPFTIYPRNRVPHANGSLGKLPGYPSNSEVSIQKTYHHPPPQPILNPLASAFLARLLNYQSNTCSFSKIKMIHKIYIR